MFAPAMREMREMQKKEVVLHSFVDLYVVLGGVRWLGRGLTFGTPATV